MESKFKAKIVEALRAKYFERNGKNRPVRLPLSLTIEQFPNAKDIRLTLTEAGVTSNMQTDAAAFEAWAMALKVWMPEETGKISLDWPAPTDLDTKSAKYGHYQRFLYRVIHFLDLFPEWFSVVDPGKLKGARTIDAIERLVLNTATIARPAPEVGSSKEEKSAKVTEAAIESALLSLPAFAAHFGLQSDLIDRQFPVGLFEKLVSKDTRIFTGGKSAIDIVAVGNDGTKFFLFELKAGGFIPIGAISELLFYTSVIRDAAGPGAKFAFNSGAESKAVDAAIVRALHVEKCTAIEAVLLVENLHPLLQHPDLMGMLNNAVARRWNTDTARKPQVHFRTVMFDSTHPEYSLIDAA